MPVVPITAGRRPNAAPPPRDPPTEPWALMAAAQMHAEGRLLANPETPDERTRKVPGND